MRGRAPNMAGSTPVRAKAIASVRQTAPAPMSRWCRDGPDGKGRAEFPFTPNYAEGTFWSVFPIPA